MIYLFTGIETITWTWNDFDILVTFCKSHGIEGVQLKTYEITQGEWYHTLGGAQKVVTNLLSKGIDVLPYGYFYGVSPNELAYVQAALKQWPKFCMNLETEWDNNPGFAQTLRNALQGHAGELWISTWANPVDHDWVQNIAILDPIVSVWQPEEYSDALIDARLQQFPPVIGKILPTYSLNPPISIDRMLVDTGISIWEYADALNNPALLSAYVAHLTGKAAPPMLWFQYPIGVPFGNPNYDVQFGGSHDMTILAPPNVPVTCLRTGSISSITSPSWGKQVGVQLFRPVNGNPYMSYLHLSAVNPALSVGDIVSTGDLIGWVGGANNDAQYLGTTNPTGSNFLNDPIMSSQVQVGIALMRGPEYGVGAGWVTFPPIDTTLDPSSLISSINYMRNAFETEWTSIIPTAMLFSGIASQAWRDYQAGHFRGPALSPEISKTIKGLPLTDWSGKPIILQTTPRGRYEWSNGKANFILYP